MFPSKKIPEKGTLFIKSVERRNIEWFKTTAHGLGYTMGEFLNLMIEKERKKDK